MILTQNRKTLLYIIIAFLFSVFIRLIWVYQFSDVEAVKFNGEFMINTNDGYYWAKGAKDILFLNEKIEQSPISSAPSMIVAFVSKLFNIKLETSLVYFPIFLSSLIIIPIILIFKLFNKLEVGFIAALLSSIAWSYYNRTMVGYYDTDFLNIVFPIILLWSLIWAIKTSDEKYFLFAAIDSIVYRWWYPQSYSLEFAFIVLVLLYTFYLVYKKEEIKTNILLMAFLIFAMVNIDILIRVFIILIIFLSIKINKYIVEKYVYYIFFLAILLFLFTGGFDPIWAQLKGYVFRDDFQVINESLSLHFYTVMKTIREAGNIPFEVFANRISGSSITFVIACIGLILFLIRVPLFFLSLPMLGLGFLALNSGLRFTIYAVPIMAVGVSYFIVFSSKILSKSISNNSFSRILQKFLLTFLTVAVLYPNLKHIMGYKTPTVFYNEEVKVLNEIKNISLNNDYMIAWWDYGYPIRYYSEMKTLIDGGTHSGKDNFAVSFILNSSQGIAAKMARLEVEYTEKRLNKLNGVKFANSNIEQMTLDYGFNNTNDFLTNLALDIDLPNKTRDIYLYLPNRMLNILPTIGLFSNLDLMNGKKFKTPLFYQSTNIKLEKNIIDLGNNIKIFQNKGLIKLGSKSYRINRFISTVYDGKGKLNKNIQIIDANSSINIIYMKNYNKFLVLGEKLFNSLYIQLFVLENYDSKYFEPIILTPLSKVYKLKI